MSDSTLGDNRSKLREFITSISTIRGDLSDITAPPFVLDTKSAVELPSFWAERPSVFVAPASAESPATRALLVLKWFLSSLRNQQYAGRSASEGIKKPINAFLGEIFLASWDDDVGLTRLVSEQVSHHPPVTACRVWNEEHGVSAEGYTRQEITFTGSINVQQVGHATLYLARHDETYLIPLPDIKIKGILTGSPYPELQGTHHIPSTSGYTSVIDFSGTGLFSSSDKRHSFEAKVYRDCEGDVIIPLYTISGHWDGAFTIHDCENDVDMETFDVMTAKTTPLTTESLAAQDPWESRRAWQAVRDALESGDMQGAADAKARIETGQREMRTSEAETGKEWQRLFFYPSGPNNDEVAPKLASQVGRAFNPEDAVGPWKFRAREWSEGRFKKPYHGDLLPDNSHVDGTFARDEERGDAIVNGTAAHEQHDLSHACSFHRQSTVVAPTPGEGQEQPQPRQAEYPQGTHTAQGPPRAMGPLPAASTSLVADRTRHESPVVLAQPKRKVSVDGNTHVDMSTDVRRRTEQNEGTERVDVDIIPKDMSMQEKAQVEDFLRDRYSTRQRR
ncbi:hypothetical protein PV04_06333 [Phialophora macrospora]|uniref:Oxysterol-binding protein n=1 Tax=Phialophora macrospora TaxID=1851006 RepID=A0A0D2CPI4_9EURO|nr:hypothetical protein PV04_06333 [Phialophora macrospora]